MFATASSSKAGESAAASREINAVVMVLKRAHEWARELKTMTCKNNFSISTDTVVAATIASALNASDAVTGSVVDSVREHAY